MVVGEEELTLDVLGIASPEMACDDDGDDAVHPRRIIRNLHFSGGVENFLRNLGQSRVDTQPIS